MRPRRGGTQLETGWSNDYNTTTSSAAVNSPCVAPRMSTVDVRDRTAEFLAVCGSISKTDPTPGPPSTLRILLRVLLIILAHRTTVTCAGQISVHERCQRNWQPDQRHFRQIAAPRQTHARLPRALFAPPSQQCAPLQSRKGGHCSMTPRRRSTK